jgi:plasmid maintenance system antidote protein VapI
MIEIKIVPRIRERLAEMGRRPVWLSRQTGIHKPSLTKIMNGQPVMLETAYSISAALGQTVEQIWIIKEVECEDDV